MVKKSNGNKVFCQKKMSESVLDVPRNVRLKFHQIVSVTADILLTLSLYGWWWWWVVVSQSTFELSWGCDNIFKSLNKFCFEVKKMKDKSI